ncbi:cellulase family glycosylhydrolase [Chitinophaga japonensis]|uniref:Cellulase (Glycosyl hydrolase family 5) n=1 Tax=Chitinophaga japonensis TaxID=104662 RepID=A0A562T2G0_CHIJA|nr:cellulase family glycosylhydrolase [Chitinophaga japonensis]TWI87006.1 cellulase (glycosyl hydrolase family 5) [Chitinophaga japonensis]
MRKLLFFLLLAFIVSTGYVHAQPGKGRDIWTREQARRWYAQQPWLVGCNFIPGTAINQLEMWQASSFDTATIDRELGWAAGLGMNTARVYLHDLLHQQDAAGFLTRMDIFLQIAARHGIKPLFVLFDSCWDPFPKTGKQRAPTPHVHNSGWVQNPGYAALKDPAQYPRLEAYVKAVVGRFANDERVLGWDIWNEPDNTNNSSYGKRELPDKTRYVLPLLQQAFAWARAANPSQPLTSGVWQGNWASDAQLKPIEKVQLEQSDIISFHNYESPQRLEECLQWLQRYERPILCTEYMARGNGSTFAGSLPVLKKYHAGAYNWGLVDGKTQTIYAWDSWRKKYTAKPALWFHDIFHTDGRPYDPGEVDLIKKMTEAGSKR